MDVKSFNANAIDEFFMMAFTKPKGIKREQLSVVCQSLIPLTMKSFVMKSYGIIARYILNLVGLYNLSFKNQNSMKTAILNSQSLP